LDGVTMTDCRLRDHDFSRSNISRLKVTGGSMSRVTIDDCEVARTMIATDLDDTNLIRCSFVGVDISASTVGEVSLLDWRSGDLLLPRSAAGWLVVPTSARAAIYSVLPQLSMTLRHDVEEWLSAEVPTLISDRFLRKTLRATTVEARALVDALLPVAASSLSEVAQPERPLS
jgi:hypothetical protein